VPLLRAYTVLNLEQTIGIDMPVDSDRSMFQPIERCEVFVASMPQRPSIHHGEARACYRPSIGVIHMPHPACFDGAEAYYSTRPPRHKGLQTLSRVWSPQSGTPDEQAEVDGGRSQHDPKGGVTRPR
jgi:antirestriction protein ArdC